MKIVFATNNQHKLSEIRSILGDSIEVLSLKDIGCDVDIPETGTTLEDNALQKAKYIYDNYHMDVFADDTGLEVDALNGAPGVYSARYASMENNAASHDSEANMARLLKDLGDDPIFQPDGYNQTFAELGMDIKNHISHRARAVAKLAEFLKK